MMKKEDYIRQLTACKQQLMQKFGLRSIRLFGSVAQGDNHEGSDLDVCMLFIAINYCCSEDET